MKKLIISAFFVVVAFLSKAQQVTITGFGTKEKFGPVASKTDFEKVLLDDMEPFVSEELPTSYKYVLDFNTKQCTLYDGYGDFVSTVIFKVISKKSDRDFQIEFTDNDLKDDYGIIVKGDVAAYTQFNGQAVSLFIFDASYIF